MSSFSSSHQASFSTKSILSLLLLLCIPLDASIWCNESFPTLEYNGKCYATLSGWDPSDTITNCQSNYLPIPDGWSIPNASEEVYDVVTQNPWGTHVLHFNPSGSNTGCAGTTQSSCCTSQRGGGSCGGDVLYQATNNTDTYGVNGCQRGVLITKSNFCDIPSGIVNNWDISTHLDGWSICYDAPYSDNTMPSSFSNCPNTTDYWIFVGAKRNISSPNSYVGAYGPSSVLSTYTDNRTTAFKSSPLSNVYWYNGISNHRSFGFAPTSSVNLINCDNSHLDDNSRLCWHYNHGPGGWRAGTYTVLDGNSIWRKIVYYKKCDPVAIPTIDPTSDPTTEPTNNPTMARYFVGPTPGTWDDGEAYCNSQQSNLASVHSAEDLSELDALCETAGDNEGCFVGLRFDTGQGIWTWSDGTSTDYYYNSVPKGSMDGSGIEQCAIWRLNGVPHNMEDVSCANEAGNGYGINPPICNGQVPTQQPTAATVPPTSAPTTDPTAAPTITSCDEAFPTLEYMDHCYATLGGYAPNDTSLSCQSIYEPLPDGWRIANASDEVYDVVNQNAWGTHILVFNPPDTISGCAGSSLYVGGGQRGCVANAGWRYTYQAPNSYRSTVCNGAVLITKDLPTPAPTTNPTNAPTTALPTSSPTTAYPTASPTTEFRYDFKLWRYDDEEDVAQKSGYTLVTVPEIQSGPIHDLFIDFMDDRSNEIEALGSWTTWANCLYYSNVCTIDLCGGGSTINSEVSHTLCPVGIRTTIDEGLQDLPANAPINHTIAIYIKTIECEFGLYENSDPGNVASNNGWDILYFSDVNGSSIYKQLLIDYMISNNYYLEAIGTVYIHNCIMIYGDGYRLLTSDVANENYIKSVCAGSMFSGQSYRLTSWQGTLIAPSPSTDFIRGGYFGAGSTAHRNAAIFKRCGYPTSQPTFSPTIDPTIDPTSDPTSDPTDLPTPLPTKYPTDNPTTPAPTDPDELICGSNDIGAYNDEAIPFEVQMSAFDGDIVFNAESSDFQVTSIISSYLNGTEIDRWTDSISDIAELRVFDLPFGVDLYFTLSAQTGVTGNYNVQILCYSDNPTSSPTTEPTNIPTFDPTSNPTTEPTQDPSSYPTAAPTRKLLGVFIKDKNGTFNDWLYRVVGTPILNRRPRFTYSNGNIQSILEYASGWSITTDFNTSDSSIEITYICNKHGKNPPLNEWISFTRTISFPDRRRLLDPNVQLFMTPLYTEFPTPSPTRQPTIDPTANPTQAPIVEPQYQQNYTITIGSTGNKSLGLNDTEYDKLLQKTINDLLDGDEDDYDIETTITNSDDDPNVKVILVIVQSNDEEITEISAENINKELQKDIIETFPEINAEELVVSVQSNDHPTTTSIEGDTFKAGVTSSNTERIIIIILSILLLCFVCLSTYLYFSRKKKVESAENKVSEMVNIKPRTNTLEPIAGENIPNQTQHNQPGASTDMNTGNDGEIGTEKNIDAILMAVDRVKSYTDVEDTETNEDIYSGAEAEIMSTPGGPEDSIGDDMNALYGKAKQPSRGFNEDDIAQEKDEDLYDLDDKPLPNEESKRDLELQDPFGAGNVRTADGGKDDNFMKWNHNDIASWILNLDDGLFRKYESDLKGKLFEEDVSGEDLVDVNYEDIKGWGVKSFKHKKILAKRIQELISNRPALEDNPSTQL